MKKLIMMYIAVVVLFCTQAATETVDGIKWTFKVSNEKVELINNPFGEQYNSVIPSSFSGPITIPSTLGSYPVVCIGYHAFADCGRLTSVIIPNSVTNIGGCAFACCSSLTDVTIPNGVTYVGSGVFQDCTALTNAVILGKGFVKDMYTRFFHGCTNLVNVITMDTCEYMFESCEQMQNVTLLEGMIEIKDRTFYSCRWLTKIDIPNSVTNIGDLAFHG